MKLTLKESYRVTEYLPVKMRALIDNCRPFTLMLPLIGGFFIVVTSVETYRDLMGNLDKVIFALSTLTLMNAAGNAINSAYDAEIDRINKPYRPIPSGIIEKNEALRFGIVLIIAALMLSLMVNLTFAFFSIIMAIFVITYSMPPFRVKRILWINNVWQALARGLIGILAAWSVLSNPFELKALAVSSIMFSFILPAQTSKDLSDMEGDREFGIKTLPVVYGIDKTVKIIALMITIPYLLLILYVWTGIFPMRTLTLTLLTPLTIYMVLGFKHPKQLDLVENTISWVLFYLHLVMFLMVFALTL